MCGWECVWVGVCVGGSVCAYADKCLRETAVKLGMLQATIVVCVCVSSYTEILLH